MTTTKISTYETTSESKIVCVVNGVDYYTFNNQHPAPGIIRESLLNRICIMQGAMKLFRNIDSISTKGDEA